MYFCGGWKSKIKILSSVWFFFKNSVFWLLNWCLRGFTISCIPFECKRQYIVFFENRANLFLNFFFVFLNCLFYLKKSKWVSTPITFGKPCPFNNDKNSNVSISNPKLASIVRRTTSAIFDKSIIDGRSFGHYISVILDFLLFLSVIVPAISLTWCLV